MNKIELKNKLGLGVTFDKLMDIIASVFHVLIQDFIAIREPKKIQSNI